MVDIPDSILIHEFHNLFSLAAKPFAIQRKFHHGKYASSIPSLGTLLHFGQIPQGESLESSLWFSSDLFPNDSSKRSGFEAVFFASIRYFFKYQRHTKGRNVALALGWLLFVYSFIRNFRASLIEFIVLTRKASGRYFILGCLFYGLAWPFDGGIFGLGKEANQFIEELLDNMGTFSFALSGFFFYKEGDIPSK